ncbi:hypothetical protein SUGI_0996110 [Cryptomeria japonica]|nr:hypothetical protein SUGI_0996110 [Cryptomeria japonica]
MEDQMVLVLPTIQPNRFTRDIHVCIISNQWHLPSHYIFSFFLSTYCSLSICPPARLSSLCYGSFSCAALPGAPFLRLYLLPISASPVRQKRNISDGFIDPVSFRLPFYASQGFIIHRALLRAI